MNALAAIVQPALLEDDSLKELNDKQVAAEQEALGAIATNPDIFDEVQTFLRVEHFSDPLHHRMFVAAREIAKTGQTVSALKITAKPKNDPGLKKIGADYPEKLARAASPNPDIPSLAIRLVECNKRREELESASKPLLISSRYTVHCATETPPQSTTQYICKGIFEPGDKSVIYGSSTAGKSFLAIYLGYKISLGRSVLGRRVHAVPVLYVCLEGQRAFVRKRLEAAKKVYGVSDKFYYITQPVDLFGGEGDAEGIIAAAKSVSAEFIIIDTFARSIGAASENEGRDINAVLEILDTVARETGAHVTCIHHTGKDKSRGMRGHSGLRGNLECAIEVKRDANDCRSIRFDKVKDGADGDELGFNLQVEELGTDEDGDMITSCVVEEERSDGDSRIAKRIKKLSDKPRMGLDFLNRCLCDLGKPAPGSQHIPRDVQTVTLDQWKDYLLKAEILNADGNPRQQFSRIRVTLQKAKIIGVWDDHVWAVT